MFRWLDGSSGAWSPGRGGASQPAESTPDARRIALDGQTYTWPQYVEAYGDDAQRCWDDAYDRSMLRRIALDGQCPLIGVRGSECIQWGCSNLIDGVVKDIDLQLLQEGGVCSLTLITP